jgi:hypothetical protein
MADPAVPSPWPGAYAAPAVRTSQIAQGVISGDTNAKLNEIAQIKKGLVWFNPSVAPFLRVSNKLKGSRSVENARYYHLEKQTFPRTVTVDGITGTATTVTGLSLGADEATRLRVSDLLFNTATGDIARVTTVTDADDILVTSNIGNGAPSGTLWAVGNVLLVIGSAYLDGSGSGAPIHVIEDEKMFFCQIFKDAIDQSDRYTKTALYEGDPWTNARKQLEFEHLLSLENAMFFGKASITRDATTGKLLTTMAGLRSLVGTNLVDLSGGGVISKAWFDKIMAESMRQGHSGYENKELAVKTGFFSQRYLSALNTVAEAQIRVIEPSEKTFGLRINQYQGSWGILNLLNAPVLNRPEVAGEGYVLDMEHVYPVNFKGRDTKFKSNIQDPDADSMKGQYISDKSLVVEVSPAHTRFFGYAG